MGPEICRNVIPGRIYLTHWTDALQSTVVTKEGKSNVPQQSQQLPNCLCTNAMGCKIEWCQYVLQAVCAHCTCQFRLRHRPDDKSESGRKSLPGATWLLVIRLLQKRLLLLTALPPGSQHSALPAPTTVHDLYMLGPNL
jgi:hypothetical protein